MQKIVMIVTLKTDRKESAAKVRMKKMLSMLETLSKYSKSYSKDIMLLSKRRVLEMSGK